MAKTITAANSVVMLSVTGLFPIPLQLQGFAADAAFDTDAIDIAETVIGVDGKMSAGFIFNTTKQTFSIMPDSDTATMFESWAAAQQSQREVFFANGTIVIQATGRIYTMKNGVLKTYKSIPGAKKVLQSRDFVIEWERVQPASF